jgi:hypothetical protein
MNDLCQACLLKTFVFDLEETNLDHFFAKYLRNNPEPGSRLDGAWSLL